MKTEILNRMESLNSVMWESAEVGLMDVKTFAPLFEIMSDLISELKEEISDKEVSA